MDRIDIPLKTWLLAGTVSAMMWAGIGYAAGVKPIRRHVNHAVHTLAHDIRHTVNTRQA